MGRRAKSRNASQASYVVRVDGRLIVGFRHVSKDTKVLLGPEERSLASCCIARLGSEPPYEWHEPQAAQFVATTLGGAVEVRASEEAP